MYELLKVNKGGVIEKREFDTKKLAIYYAYFLLSLRHVAKAKILKDNRLIFSIAVNNCLKGNVSYFVRQFNSLW